MKQAKYLWLHKLPLAKQIKLQLLTYYNDIDDVYHADSKTLEYLGCSAVQIEKFMHTKGLVDKFEEDYAKMIEEGIGVVTIEDERYPKQLKEIFDPPILFFIKGDEKWLAKPSVAIVGSRKCSEYGFGVARKLANDLTACNITVISGMARGIDEAGHKGALQQGGTVAVLGTGVNVCYPKQNTGLYQQILNEGCIVSEYFPNTTAMPYQFPERNRMISGLSLGVVVVEAEERSGSLITAQLALEQGREVFAVPGNIYSGLSKGTNRLIQAGAKLVMGVEDIIEEIASQLNEPKDIKKENNYSSTSIGLDKLQIMVYDCLSWQPIQIDTMTSQIDLTIDTIEMILLQLEIKGLIQRLPGRRYVLAK